MKVFYYNSIIGKIGIVEQHGYVEKILFENQIINAVEDETQVIKNAYKQLNEYFLGERCFFNIPVKLRGTEFQKKVWSELLKIPYGQTVSYKDIAIRIGNEKATRAVGSANNRNPLPIIVPCHRVIGKNGKLIGYSGGTELKQKLLNAEQKFKN